MARQFDSVMTFTAQADNLSGKLNGILAQLQAIQSAATEAGNRLDTIMSRGGTPAGSAGLSGGMSAQDWTRQYQSQLQRDAEANAATVAQMQRDIADKNMRLLSGATSTGGVSRSGTSLLRDDVLDASEKSLNRVGDAAQKTGRSFSTMAVNIVEGMLIWQGVNTIMNAVIGTIDTTVQQTMALDSASARLSTTLNTSKDAAREYAQAMAMRGIEYGLAPEMSYELTQYAARVSKNPATEQSLFKTAGMLGQVTGEDPKKLIDDLNVTSKQTGLSIERLGDMSARAFQNSGTSASQYLNILREIGPLAKESGIDIDRMAGIAAQAADRMGGSLADAANTMTRLIKAVSDPSAAQSEVLRKYNITTAGKDVQTLLDEVSKAGMSAPDLAALGGRPGQPSAANDIRTMIAVFKEYNGELQKGAGLQDQYAKSTNSIDMANKQLKASFDMLFGSIGTGLANWLHLSDYIGMTALGVTGLADAIQKGDWQFLGQVLQLGNLGQGWIQSSERGARVMYGQQRAQSETPTPPPNAPATAPTTQPTSPLTPAQNLAQMLIGGETQVPTSAVDLSKYTSSQLAFADTAKAQASRQQWIDAYDKFYTSLGIPADKKEEFMRKAKEMIDSYVAVFDTGKGLAIEFGAEAFFKQQLLQQQAELQGAIPTSATNLTQYSDEEIKRAMALVPTFASSQLAGQQQMLQAQGLPPAMIQQLMQAEQERIQNTTTMFGRGTGFNVQTGAMAAFLPQALGYVSQQKALEDRLADLRAALEDLNDTEKKRAQLEGQWNIPTGAKLLVPLTAESQQLIKEHGGETEDQAKDRQRERLQKQIAEAEAALADLKSRGTDILGPTKGVVSPFDKYAATPTDQFGQSLAQATANVQAFSRALAQLSSPPRNQTYDNNKTAFDQALAQLNNPPRAIPTLAQSAVPALNEQNITVSPQSISLKAYPLSINLQSITQIDGRAVAEAMQRYQSQDLVYESVASGAMAQ